MSPTKNGPGKAYSQVSVLPSCKFRNPRPTRFSESMAYGRIPDLESNREAYDARDDAERRHETSGNPDASVLASVPPKRDGIVDVAANVLDAAICAAEASVRNAALATARFGPRDGVAPVGLMPPRL